MRKRKSLDITVNDDSVLILYKGGKDKQFDDDLEDLAAGCGATLVGTGEEMFTPHRRDLLFFQFPTAEAVTKFVEEIHRYNQYGNN